MKDFVKIRWIEDGIIEVFYHSYQEYPSIEDIKKGETQWVDIIDEKEDFVTVQFGDGSVSTINRKCFEIVEDDD